MEGAEDFHAFLSEMGLTQDQVVATAASHPRPLARRDTEPYSVKPSAIHGLGCFATRNIDGFVGRLKQGSDWFEAGRYINHSAKPNAVAVREGDVIVAFGSIPKGQEITLDYRQVRDTIGGFVMKNTMNDHR